MRQECKRLRSILSLPHLLPILFLVCVGNHYTNIHFIQEVEFPPVPNAFETLPIIRTTVDPATARLAEVQRFEKKAEATISSAAISVGSMIAGIVP